MANSKQPGPMCQLLKTPMFTQDGTLCRCESPRPGVISEEPEVLDQFSVGIDVTKPLGEEAWFEQRYPDLMEDARLRMVEVVDQWVYSHWNGSPFPDQKQRINVSARDTAYQNKDGTVRKVARNDNLFEPCGDKPQTPREADQVLGSFSIDLETPVPIMYSTKVVGGKTLASFNWTGVMYVEDVLGLQETNNIVQLLGKWTLQAAPSRTVKRARWYIGDEGLTYVIAPGDSLSSIAGAICGDVQKWRILHDANRSTIPDPNRVTPGQRIIIPAELVP